MAPKGRVIDDDRADDIGRKRDEGRRGETQDEAQYAAQNACIIRIDPFGPHKAEQVALPEIGEVGVVGHRDRLVVGQEQRRAGSREHCCQSRDEGQDIQPRDDERVECPCQKPRTEAADQPRK